MQYVARSLYCKVARALDAGLLALGERRGKQTRVLHFRLLYGAYCAQQQVLAEAIRVCVCVCVCMPRQFAIPVLYARRVVKASS